MKNYEELIRKSIRKDFKRANFRRNERTPRSAKQESVRRVSGLSDDSGYARFRRFIVGKLVRIVRPGWSPGENWVSFIHEEDRKNLNRAAGYSDAKYEFLIDGIKLD